MSATDITCPNCGVSIPISEALAAQVRTELEARLSRDHALRLKQAVAQAEQRARGGLEVELADLKNRLAESTERSKEAQERELALRREARKLEEAFATQAERIQAELEAKHLKDQAERVEKAATAAAAQAREQSEAQLKQLNAELETQRQKAKTAEQAELALRKERSALEERGRALDLEVARKLDAQRQDLEAALRERLATEHDLKLKERDKQIADLRESLVEAKRKSEQGSQELQGEILELDIQAELERRFPGDRIEPVPKGMRGADIIQHVHNQRLEHCGSIVWETKNTQHWQRAWIEKLKDDQRTVGAAVAVLVSVRLPDDLDASAEGATGSGFGRIDGVWIAGLRAWPALAIALREQLIQVAYARAASEGKSEKMELLYQYLAGDEFRHRVETIVEAFTAMQVQIQKERRAMEKHWSAREKQLRRVIDSTAGMYGALQGIVGSGLGAIPALELDDSELLEAQNDD